jgi:hypothetical protein
MKDTGPLYVIWYTKGDEWKESRAMSKREVEKLSELLTFNGYKVEIKTAQASQHVH